MICFQSLSMFHMKNMKIQYPMFVSMIVMSINKIFCTKPLPVVEMILQRT